MILYHGSNLKINKIDLEKCRTYKDFGLVIAPVDDDDIFETHLYYESSSYVYEYLKEEINIK